MRRRRKTAVRNRTGQTRGLRIEPLESRQLLAADVFQNPIDPYDVNNDGTHSPGDVLMVINSINGTGGEGESGGRPKFLDVSGDGLLAPNDVLLGINRMSSEGASELAPALAERLARLAEEGYAVNFENLLPDAGAGLAERLDGVISRLQQRDGELRERLGRESVDDAIAERIESRGRQLVDEWVDRLRDEQNDLEVRLEEVQRRIVELLERGDSATGEDAEHDEPRETDPDAGDAERSAADRLERLIGRLHQHIQAVEERLGTVRERLDELRGSDETEPSERLQEQIEGLEEHETELVERLEQLGQRLAELLEGSKPPDDRPGDGSEPGNDRPAGDRLQQLLERLEQRATDVEQRLADVRERLARLLEQEQPGPRAEALIERLEEHQSRLVAELEALRQRIETLLERLADGDGDGTGDEVPEEVRQPLLDRLRQRAAALEQRLAEVRARLERLLSDGHDSAAERLEALRERLAARADQLEQRIAELLEHLEQVVSGGTMREPGADDPNEPARRLEMLIEQLREQAAGLAARIEQVSEQLDELTLTGELEHLEERLERLWSAFQQRQATLRQRLDELLTEGLPDPGSIESLLAEVGDLHRADVSQVSAEVGEAIRGEAERLERLSRFLPL